MWVDVRRDPFRVVCHVVVVVVCVCVCVCVCVFVPSSELVSCVDSLWRHKGVSVVILQNAPIMIDQQTFRDSQLKLTPQ